MQVKLPESIRTFRKARNLPQEQLAEVLNVSVGVISKWELGLFTPELAIIMQLAEFFETSVDVLQGYQLIAQNTDESISLTSIQIRIAQLHINLGEAEKGVALLKANNPGRLNDALIGQTLASVCDRPEEGMVYLSEVMPHLLDTQNHLAIGLINVYEKRRDYRLMVEAMDWILAIQRACGMPGRISFLNKLAALYLACKGYACLKLDRREEARQALKEARDEAMAFDANPDYSVDHFRFVSPKQATCYNDFGMTAMEGIQKFVDGQNEEGLSALWKDITQA